MGADAPAEITVKDAVKQTGRNTASGTGSTGKCPDCVKEHLAIYLALPGVGPAKAVAKLPRPEAFTTRLLNIRAVTDEAAYFIRPLRPGYVYVFKEKAPEAEQWDAYVVGSDGLLRKEAVADLPADPSQISHPTEKQCNRPEHNPFCAQFISIDPERYKKIWVAFSDSRWSDKVLDDYANDAYKGDKTEACRTRRMTPLDLSVIKTGAEVKGVIKASAEALEANVAGFKAGDITDVDNSRLFFSVPRRDKQAAAVAKRMEQASKNTKSSGVIVMLHDTAGMLAELNWQRQRSLAEMGAFQSDNAWKKLSASAIAAVRERIKQRKKAEVIQDKTGKPWSKDNDPKQVNNSLLPVRRWLFDSQIKDGSIPKDSVFEVTERPDPKNPSADIGRIRVPTDSAAAKAAESDYEEFEKQYDEGQRTQFLKDYERDLGRLKTSLSQWEKEWSAWLNVSVVPDGMPDITSIVRFDHRSDDRKCAPNYVGIVGQCVGTGPLSEESQPWFVNTVKLPLKDDKQILLRSLFGNQDCFINWAHETKPDKVYDALKTIAGADDLKLGKFAGAAVSVYANGVLAGISATAMVLNKNGSIDKRLKDRLTRYVCATLKLWDDVEIGFIKIVGAKLGDFHQGMLVAAFARAIDATDISRTASGGIGKAARGKLSSKVSEKTIDALLWTADKAKDLEELLKSLPASTTAETRAAAVFEAAEQNMQKALKGARRQIPAGATRNLVTRIVKGTDSVLGKPGGVMAAGVLYIQWAQATENFDKVMKLDGADRLDALLGLGDAMTSIMGASAEMYQAIREAKLLSAKQAIPKILAARVAIAANGLAGIANLFNSVQSGTTAYRRFTEGDKDATVMYSFASGAFFGAAVASFAMMGGNVAFFGPLLGLGPAGWAVLLTVAAVGLTYAALSVEDSDAAKWVARNKFWSTKERTDPPFVDWRDEANAFNALWYGVKIDLPWSDWPGKDKITMKIVIAEPTAEQGWRYRLWATLNQNGKMDEIVMYSGASKVEPMAYDKRDQDVTQILATLSPTRTLIVENVDFEAESIKTENGQVVIERVIRLDDGYFDRARMKLEYFPDAAERSECVELAKVAED